MGAGLLWYNNAYEFMRLKGGCVMDLKGRDFLKLLDFTPEEIVYLLDLAAELKEKKKKGFPWTVCAERTLP